MNVLIMTPEKKVFDGEAISVQVPGVKGKFEVLNNHAPIVSLLEKGQVRIITNENEVLKFDIEQGFIEVLQNEISILTQTAEA